MIETPYTYNMDLTAAPRAASSHHLDSDSSDLASPSSSSGATAQLTPDNDPDSSSSDDYEKDDEMPWADDDNQDGRQLDLESGSGAYELQTLGSRAGRKPARDHRDGKEEEDEQQRFIPGAPATRQRLSDSSTAASFQLYTPDEEQAVVRKFDRKLVLFLSFCYMLSFLDRSSMPSPPSPLLNNETPSRICLLPSLGRLDFGRLADPTV